VHTSFFNPCCTAFLSALPFVVLLMAALLRLDALMATPCRPRQRQPAFGLDRNGKMFLTDPDGRPWYVASHPK